MAVPARAEGRPQPDAPAARAADAGWPGSPRRRRSAPRPEWESAGALEGSAPGLRGRSPDVRPGLAALAGAGHTAGILREAIRNMRYGTASWSKMWFIVFCVTVMQGLQ